MRTKGLISVVSVGALILLAMNLLDTNEDSRPSDLTDLYADPDSPVNILDISALQGDVMIEQDVAVIVRDGTRLSATIYRPKPRDTNSVKQYPVVMMLTAYHKDEGPIRYPDMLRRHLEPDYNMGPINVSPWTPWEGPDPAYWVQQGYAVVMLDSRGYGKSDGVANLFSLQDRYDFHDAITWAGVQGWSNGNVGLTGVSYLAIAQWAAASSGLNSEVPAALKAIIPWEGQSDVFREVLFHGGIPETAFTEFWLDRARQKSNAINLPPKFVIQFGQTRPMLVKWGQENLQPPSGIALESITVPALICASWSDHGMHTRGSLEAFKRIGSAQKWLFTHGRSKWPFYYSPEAVAVQTAFFDHFLKGENNDFEKRPAVRLEIRDTLEEYQIRHENKWPLVTQQEVAYYLDAAEQTLQGTALKSVSRAQYDAQKGSTVFRKTFAQETELTGNMKLKLWVKADGASDMDLFIAIKKYDVLGNIVNFYGKAGYNKTPVAMGWLRVSQREKDAALSTPLQPVLSHTRSQLLEKNEIVPVEIEILPSSTRFLAGEILEVAIAGHDHIDHPALAHKKTVNKGQHIIYTGGKYDSHLLVPLIPKQ